MEKKPGIAEKLFKLAVLALTSAGLFIAMYTYPWQFLGQTEKMGSDDLEVFNSLGSTECIEMDGDEKTLGTFDRRLVVKELLARVQGKRQLRPKTTVGWTADHEARWNLVKNLPVETVEEILEFRDAPPESDGFGFMGILLLGLLL